MPANCLSVANVNGALVGGASLKAADFLGIADAYRSHLTRHRIRRWCFEFGDTRPHMPRAGLEMP